MTLWAYNTGAFAYQINNNTNNNNNNNNNKNNFTDQHWEKLEAQDEKLHSEESKIWDR